MEKTPTVKDTSCPHYPVIGQKPRFRMICPDCVHEAFAEHGLVFLRCMSIRTLKLVQRRERAGEKVRELFDAAIQSEITVREEAR